MAPRTVERNGAARPCPTQALLFPSTVTSRIPQHPRSRDVSPGSSTTGRNSFHPPRRLQAVRSVVHLLTLKIPWLIRRLQIPIENPWTPQKVSILLSPCITSHERRWSESAFTVPVNSPVRSSRCKTRCPRLPLRLSRQPMGTLQANNPRHLNLSSNSTTPRSTPITLPRSMEPKRLRKHERITACRFLDCLHRRPRITLGCRTIIMGLRLRRRRHLGSIISRGRGILGCPSHLPRQLVLPRPLGPVRVLVVHRRDLLLRDNTLRSSSRRCCLIRGIMACRGLHLQVRIGGVIV